MKFSQLIEYNMRNIFFEKSYTKFGGETSPRPFFAKLKLSISLDQKPKALCLLFQLYAKLRVIEIFETKLQTTCFYLILRFFKREKDLWNQSPCLILCIFVKEKYLSCYILLIDQVPLTSCLHFVKYLTICVFYCLLTRL